MQEESAGRLLSVNVGRAAPLELLQGETITSGFFKEPTGHAEWVGPLGLVSDDHVDDVNDPDRAVLFYQRSHYDYWRPHLNRDLPFGMFGEQLTFDGPPEDEIWIGDRLSIGDVLLEVTQPRIPCRRMAARFGQEDMPIQFMQSGRTGFFCKVITPGELQVGSDVVLVERGPEQFPLPELTAVLHSNEPDPVQLERALASPVLPALVRAKLTKLRDRMAANASGWQGNRPLIVTSRASHGQDVVAFEVADPSGTRLPDFVPGQFLTVSLQVAEQARPVVRTYTIAGRSADGTGYRLGIKREHAPADTTDVPAGVGSGHFHDHVHTGAVIDAKAPRGQFVLNPGTRPVVLISAGIGVTPMLAMLEHLAAAPASTGDPDERQVYFIHSTRSAQHRAFGPLIDELIASNPRFHRHLVYGRPGATDQLGVDFDAAGRITADKIHELLPDPDADYYLCGPAQFMTDIAGGLHKLGVPEDQIHYEFFGAATSLFGGPGQPAGDPVLDDQGRPVTVTFARSGVTVPWRENTFSLLALAESAGLRPEASCRTGLCGTCVCRLDDGDFEYAIDPLDGPTPGKVFLCCARPLGSVMVDL